MSMTMIVTTVAILAVVYLAVRKLTTPRRYPEVALEEIDRDALRRHAEELLRASAGWRVERSEPGITLATSLDPFPVRCAHYQVEVEADFDDAVAYVQDIYDCGPSSRETQDKLEETLYDKDRGGANHEWIRRSYHVSPPPGGSRDAVVLYVEDRPAPGRHRIVFRSVDRMAGRWLEPKEGASRFMVHPGVHVVDEVEPGRLRIRKVEAVDPGGRVGPLVNNYFASLLFFRKYMFEEARRLRDHLVREKR